MYSQKVFAISLQNSNNYLSNSVNTIFSLEAQKPKNLCYGTTLCLQKVATFKLSLTLSNLNRLLQFFMAKKLMKFAMQIF